MSQVLQPQHHMDSRMGGIKRQATWDALPDIDFFSIPVDDFFENYVSELGAQAAPQAVPSPLLTTTHALNGHLDPVLEHFPHSGTQQINGLIMPAEAAALAPDSQHGSGASFAQVDEMPPLPVEPDQELPALGNIITSGFEAQQGVQRRSGSGSHSQDSGNYGAQHLHSSPQGSGSHEHMSNDESPDDDGGRGSGRAKKGSAAAGGSGGTKSKRNARQQDQNKQAQQRYRERRKAKFAEMEQALALMSAQLDQLKGVQAHNTTLQGQAAELQRSLHSREAEVLQLRRALADAGVEPEDLCTAPFSRPQPQNEYKPIPPTECANNRAERERRREEEIQALLAATAKNVQELRILVEQHNLRHCDPSGVDVPSEVSDRVQALVERGCGLCQNAMRAEGIKVLALFSCDVDRMGTISCRVEAAKWDRILDVLRVNPTQAEALLDLRAKHLQNLHALYEDRQRLNLQAMSLMLPKNIPRRDQQLPNAETLESRMDCMRITGSYGACADSAVQLDAILDDIKCNLRKEQRTVMQLSWFTMHRVLTPIQSGLFVVEVFPGHCDCLALSNALAKRMGATNDGVQGSS